jgi:hypothetical protein
MIQTLFGNTEEKPSCLDRMKQAVTRTRESLSERIEDLVTVGKEIDRDTLDELEATLISADLGTATTETVLETLRVKVDRKQIGDIDELKRVLKDELLKILDVAERVPVKKVEGEPEVILVVGVKHRENNLDWRWPRLARSRQRCCWPRQTLSGRPYWAARNLGRPLALKSLRTSRAATHRRCCSTHCRPPKHEALTM